MELPQNSSSELISKTTLIPRTGVASVRAISMGTVKQGAHGVISTPAGGLAVITSAMAAGATSTSAKDRLSINCLMSSIPSFRVDSSKLRFQGWEPE